VERGSSYIAAAVLILLYGFLLLPLIVVVMASVSNGQVLHFPPEGFSLKWYARFFADDTFMRALRLSLQIAALSTILVSVVATAAALFYRALSARLGHAFRILMLMPLLLPEILTAIGLLFFFYRIGLGQSWLGLLIGHTVVTLPFAFLSVTAALQQVEPNLEEASVSLGASGLRTFVRIVLPLIKPGIFTGALFAFITSFDMFTMSFLLKPIGGNTLPLAVFDYLKYDFDPTTAAAASVSIVLALAVVVLVERTVGLRRAL
jgi:putative spermidine/putrescine transport system permease protein